MNIGKVVRIHNIPDPERRYYPQPERNPYWEPNVGPYRITRIKERPNVEPEPIPAPDWPVKVPEKVEAE